jgi:beta-glucosidase-like glycosyl hydrolase
MISGMQTKDAAGHPKMLAYLKHYTIYSREQNRMHSEANVTTFDLHDSYLPQYEEAFKANASGVMCSEPVDSRCSSSSSVARLAPISCAASEG